MENPNAVMNQTKLGYNDTESALDVKNLKYMTEEKINSTKIGYENNNFLIETVIKNKFDSFAFLLSDKNCEVMNKNVNGWSAIHYVVKFKRFSNIKLIIIRFFGFYV